MKSLLPILLIILTAFILLKHYNHNMKIGEKTILIMIFFLVVYTCYTYAKLEAYEDFNEIIYKDSVALNANNKLNALVEPSESFNKLIKSEEFDDNIQSIFKPNIIIKKKNKSSPELLNYNNKLYNNDGLQNNNKLYNNDGLNNDGLNNDGLNNDGLNNGGLNNGGLNNGGLNNGGLNNDGGLNNNDGLNNDGGLNNNDGLNNVSKHYYPGFQYIDPKKWDVPQKRPPVCIPSNNKIYPPSGIIEAKFSFLELNEMGNIANTEDSVKQTNIGSILPPFEYKILPYAIP